MGYKHEVGAVRTDALRDLQMTRRSFICSRPVINELAKLRMIEPVTLIVGCHHAAVARFVDELVEGLGIYVTRRGERLERAAVTEERGVEEHLAACVADVLDSTPEFMIKVRRAKKICQSGVRHLPAPRGMQAPESGPQHQWVAPCALDEPLHRRSGGPVVQRTCNEFPTLPLAQGADGQPMRSVLARESGNEIPCGARRF